MPHGKRFLPGVLVAALVLLPACSGGGGSGRGEPPHSDIDLVLTSFQISPTSAGSEDVLTLTGTIQNQGIETANPLPGNSFHISFNLSKNGTFNPPQQGFLVIKITVPIPAGGTFNFTYQGAFGAGDTLAIFGNFCTSQDCTPPETGVIGAWVDSLNEIGEIEEGNNFKFDEIQVAGSRIASLFQGCDPGTVGGDVGSPGCDLHLNDGVDAIYANHRRCSTCVASEALFLNEIHRTVYVSITVRGCSYTGGSLCSASWIVKSSRYDPVLQGPLPPVEQDLNCIAISPQVDHGCAWVWDQIDNVLTCIGGCNNI